MYIKYLCCYMANDNCGVIIYTPTCHLLWQRVHMALVKCLRLHLFFFLIWSSGGISMPSYPRHLSAVALTLVKCKGKSFFPCRMYVMVSSVQLQWTEFLWFCGQVTFHHSKIHYKCS